MASWGEFDRDYGELADVVRRCFAILKHATVATLRRDGSPRISGIEVEFTDGAIVLAMMPGSRKALDLRRDPRFALHSPTHDAPQDDSSSWLGEAKLARRADDVDVADTDSLTEPRRFQLDLLEVTHTNIGRPPDHLVITSWTPTRGVQHRERR